MSKQAIKQLFQLALESAQHTGELPQSIPHFQIEQTKAPQHGDFACNIALVAAKVAKKKPRDIADIIVNHMPPSDLIERMEIAGPGFINIFLSKTAFYSVIQEIINQGEQYGHCDKGRGQRILIEYVSSNPTGPLHVGHGRHAAFGAVVSDLLSAIGYDVFREYYVNDAGRQMDILAVSTWLRYLSLCGEEITFPANAYQGEYVVDIARVLQKDYDHQFCMSSKKIFENLPPDEPDGGDKEIYIDALIERAQALLGKEVYDIIFNLALNSILSDIHDDLAAFGVRFQNWFSERHFIKSDAVERNLAALREKDQLYERDGALWFRSTDFQDEKDRVMQRRNGQRTYFANDFAYHINKFERGFDAAIDIFGSDHHGYIPRMKAGLKARGIPPEKLNYLLLQFVTLYRHGQQAQMSTRSGSFVTLRALREEVGNDAARFFYVMRKSDQPIDFDLDLAKSKTNENPVYYIQYAHARICSVFRQLKEKAMRYDQAIGLSNLNLLKEPQEVSLLAQLLRYPDIILTAAENYEPHQLTNYLRDLAADFHAYYNSHQFLVADERCRHARLTFIAATRQVIANGLKLLGVSTPESM